MKQVFEKWHGCRNDFIVTRVDANENYTFDCLRRQASALCKRDGSGIGADGIIVLHMPAGERLMPDRLTIINSDGSMANTCGNGIRCAAASILRAFADDGRPFPEGMNVVVSDQEVGIRMLGTLPHQATPLLAVDMGHVKINDQNPWHEEAVQACNQLCTDLGIHLDINEIGTCQILNQHIVIFCASPDTQALRALGPAIQSGWSWDGINLHIATEGEFSDSSKAQISAALSGKVEEYFNALVWERGAGETAACGSGACAIAACAYASGTSSREGWLTIAMPGGLLHVKQSEDDDPVTLAGPAQHVFTGSFDV